MVFQFTIDNGAWKVNDKDWMAARKEEWESIKENLSKMEPHVPRRAINIHKKFFLTGELDKDFLDWEKRRDNDLIDPFPKGAYPFFQLWYHPEPTVDNYNAILSNLNADEFNVVRGFVFRTFKEKRFAGNYGLFGGREEFLVKVLYPKIEPDSVLTFSDGSQCNGAPELGMIEGLSVWRIKPALCMPGRQNTVGQYLWDHFVCACKVHPEAIFKEGLGINEFKKMVELIYDFDAHESAQRDNPKACELRERLLKQFQNRELPDILLAYWDDYVASKG